MVRPARKRNGAGSFDPAPSRDEPRRYCFIVTASSVVKLMSEPSLMTTW